MKNSNMSNIGVLCFDYDGVVINNTQEGFDRIHRIVKELGLPPLPDYFIRTHWGKKVDALAPSILSYFNEDSPKNIDYFKQRLYESAGVGKLDSRLMRILPALSHYFFITMITNRDRCDLKRGAREIGLDLRIFDYIQAADDYPSCKPDGDVFKPLLQWSFDVDSSLTANNIVYFGDTVSSDYQAVKNARCKGQSIRFVGVCSGVNTFEEFHDAGLSETEIVPSHDTLPFYLDRLKHGR